MAEERGLTTRPENPLALMQSIDVGDVVKSDLILPELKDNGEHPWAYSFKQQGQLIEGLGIDGVEDACRALASKGEIIQELECRLEMQDDNEAFFIAKAGRFAISPEGQHIGPLDTAIRALRQPKYIKLREGGVRFNEKWFEVGVAKANRNAKEALIPEAMKQKMLAIAREAKRSGNGPTQPTERREERREPTPPPRQQPPSTQAAAPKPAAPTPPVTTAPAGAKWEDVTVGEAIRSPQHVWAKAPFSAAVEGILGEGKCRPAVLKVELSEGPPLEDDILNGMTLGLVVEWLEAKHPKKEEEVPSAASDHVDFAPPEDEPLDAVFTSEPEQEVLI